MRFRYKLENDKHLIAMHDDAGKELAQKEYPDADAAKLMAFDLDMQRAESIPDPVAKPVKTPAKRTAKRK